MGLPDLTQAERLELPIFDRRYLIHWELPSKTLYISDRSFKYDYGAGTQDYEDYLFDLSDLTVELPRIEPSGNIRISLLFKNQKILTYDHLIEMDEDYRFIFSVLKIYELRLIASGETFSSDVKELVFRGVCGQPYSITRREFRIDVHNTLLTKRDRLPLQVIDTDTFSGAEPDDIGRIRNTIYGSVEQVPCLGVVTGAVDTLDDDITDSASSITISGISKVSFPTGSQTIQIEEEQISITSRSGNTFTVDERGINGTTAQAHDKGSQVFEILTEYVYEIAKHPLKAISNVYAKAHDGRMILVDIGDYTAYTGQTGDQKSGYGATAVIAFDVLPQLIKQVGLAVSEGDHGHETTGSTTDQRYPTGAGSPDTGAGMHPEYMIDEDDNTYCRLTGGSNFDDAYVTFNSSGSGTVNWRKVRFLYSSTSPSGNDKVRIGTAAWQSVAPTGGVDDKQTIEKTFSGDEWNLTVYFHHDGVYGEFRIHEVYWCEVNYGTGVISNPATGVQLSGNSTADTVIGTLVTADVEGYKDTTGNYGGSGTLIERPDWVIKHILIELLGETASDIGTTFAAAGTAYGSTYKFGFILHEIATQADELLRVLAFQARSKFLEWKGKFELSYISDSLPTDIKEYDDDIFLEEPIFGFTNEIDIRNKIFVLYKRDYRQSGKDAYDGVETESDSTSITDNGERDVTVELSACRTSTMAANWAAWYLGQLAKEWKKISLTIPWIGKNLEPWDGFRVIWSFFSGLVWEPLEVTFDQASERVTISGRAISDVVESDLEAKFDIWLTAQSDLEIKFDTLALVQADVQFVYDQEERISSDLQAVFDVRTIVQSDLEAKFDITSTIQSDLEAKFDIWLLAQSDVQAVFDIVDYYIPGNDEYTSLLIHYNSNKPGGLLGSTDITSWVSDVARGDEANNQVSCVFEAVGTAQGDTSEKKFGTASLELDGDSDYLNLITTVLYSFNNCYYWYQDGFTLDFWVKHDDHAGTEYYYSHWVTSAYNWNVRHVHGTGICVDVIYNSITEISMSGGEITDTNWHHVAIVRYGEDWGIYLDGVQVAYDSWSGIANWTNKPITIGAFFDGTTASDFFDGHMDDIRLTFGNEFGAEPNSGLTDTITEPTEAHINTEFACLILPCDGTDGHTDFYDIAGSKLIGPGPRYDDPSKPKKFGNASGDCTVTPGANNRHGVKPWSGINMGSGPFTVDFWVYFKYVGQDHGLFCLRPTVAGDRYGCYVKNNAGNDELHFYALSVAGLAIYLDYTTFNPSAETWYHIAVIRGWGGSANSWALCVNGTAVATGTDSNVMPSGGNYFYIANAYYQSSYLEGHIEEMRVSKGVARWTSNFTPPSVQYGPG